MILPFQCLAALGQDGLLCTSRGSGIYVFGTDGLLLSSWEHPNARPVADPSSERVGNILQGSDGPVGPEPEDAPSSKRRKLDPKDESTGTVEEGGPEPEDVEQQGDNAHGKDITSRKGKKGQAKRTTNASQELPVVILLRVSSDGSHVVAVTGQDKCIWVLEHDGQGHLKELSQRPMPKRPCDVTLTADGKTLLVADKFGDVYSLPLIPSANAPTGASQSSTPTPSPAGLPPAKGANVLTVHSQRNRQALEDQIRKREKGLEVAQKKEAGPSFDHDLLLGHVSMLTAIAAASSGGRAYILTADRDEHIRVSRGLPHAHVIEGYCLGHTAFVNALCLLPSGVLVSGGGDDELYFWDWSVATLEHKVDLLSHVQGVVPGASRVAVSGLYSHGDANASASLGTVMAICERVPAIFIVELLGGDQTAVQTLALAGNPLDLASVPTPGGALRLVVGVDMGGDSGSGNEGPTSGLVVFHRAGDRWEPLADFTFQEAGASGLDLSRAELDKMLYTVENLRKTDREDDGAEAEAETPVVESETGSVPP